MGKSGLIFGKMMTGVAQVAVPAAMQERAAAIQSKRDATLHKYQMEQQGAQNTAAMERQTASQEFQAGQQSAAFENQANLQKLGFEHAEKLSEAQQKHALDVIGRNQEFASRFDTMDAAQRALTLNNLTEQLKTQGLDQDIKQLQLDRTKADSKLLEMMQPDYRTDSGNLLTNEQRDQVLQTYYLTHPDAKPKITIFQPKDQYGNYLDEPWVFEDTQLVGSGGMNASNPTWFLQPGAINGPQDYKRALQEIQIGLQEKKFTRQEAMGYIGLMKQLQPEMRSGRNTPIQ